MKQFLLRLQALFLATIFVAGSFGLSEADVLLDHPIEQGPVRGRVHLENLGGCADHAEHCVLNRLLADFRDLAPADSSLAIIPQSGHQAIGAIAARILPLSPDLSYQSRAPPTLD